MESSKNFTDRRKSPRMWIYLPLEYRLQYAPYARGGVVIDANETGFHIYSTEDIPIGTKLKIAVLFPGEYGIPNFEVFTEIIWKKVSVERRGKGYQYGLKFIQISEEDCLKIRKLLSSGSE
jgi:hypothetical protein